MICLYKAMQNKEATAANLGRQDASGISRNTTFPTGVLTTGDSAGQRCSYV